MHFEVVDEGRRGAETIFAEKCINHSGSARKTNVACSDLHKKCSRRVVGRIQRIRPRQIPTAAVLGGDQYGDPYMD
jgi:hypothetical protein